MKKRGATGAKISSQLEISAYLALRYGVKHAESNMDITILPSISYEDPAVQ